ncbi:hypothetical protein [Gimesia sp.]|uniref:hypothetical protein n=1 Tax=Gimesia sp. TaxID=2024833 RepID=UPI003A929776
MKSPLFNSLFVKMFHQNTINSHRRFLTGGLLFLIFMLTSCDSPGSQKPVLEPKVHHTTHEIRHSNQLENKDLKGNTNDSSKIAAELEKEGERP